jgi:hypothetical protein
MFEPLESRALMICNILQESFRINNKIADNENNKAMARIKACKRMVNDQYNILYSLRKGTKLC